MKQTLTIILKILKKWLFIIIVTIPLIVLWWVMVLLEVISFEEFNGTTRFWGIINKIVDKFKNIK